MVRASPDPNLQTRLSERSWELCREALERGTLTLTNEAGVVTARMTLTEKDLLRHVQWLASLTARKRPRTAMPNLPDFALAETR